LILFRKDLDIKKKVVKKLLL